MADNLVEVEHVQRSYLSGGRRSVVLDEVSFALARGETVALLGSSGSGKSTLLNMISGIDVPDAGSVSIAGQQLTTMREGPRTRFRCRHIGFVYQFFNLIPTLTAAENVGLALELNGVLGAQREARVARLLAELDLADVQDRFADQLSGGEQQRVAIARALIHKPALVLADEPTGNLDADSGARVLALLAELSAAQGSTLLLVTHSLAVARSADRVLTLDRGRVVAQQHALAW